VAYFIACDGTVTVNIEGRPACSGEWILHNDTEILNQGAIPDLSTADALSLTNSFVVLMVTVFVWKKLRNIN